MELRTLALQALELDRPEAKCAAVQAIWTGQPAWTFARTSSVPGPIPGRPARPRLIAPGEVPNRTPFTAEGRAALVHAICHIEFNAIKIPFNDSQSTIIKFHCDSI